MPFSRLTPKERDVADLICLHGLSVVAVAHRLHMSIKTARAHTRSIAGKLANPHGLPAVKLIQSYRALRLLAEREQRRLTPPTGLDRAIA